MQKYFNQSQDNAFKKRNKVIQEGEIVESAQEVKKWGQTARDWARKVNRYQGTSFLEQDLGGFRAQV